MTGEEDSDREVRAMVLLSLPYPPLPVLAARIEEGRHLPEDGTTTSHTLFARALAECTWRNDDAANAARRLRQQAVFKRFLHAMGPGGGFALDDPERLYQLYCRFTLEHLATYLPEGHPIDVRFQPYAHSAKGDRAHRKFAEYMAAQSILFEDPVPITREQYARDYTLGDMLFALRDRLGHLEPLRSIRAPEKE